jgi:MFS family permease
LLRIISGFSASLPLVFLPLWIDEYGPSDGQAQWMAAVQMGAPIGQFAGAAVAALFTGAFQSFAKDWRSALLVQAALLVVATVLVICTPAIQVNISNIESLRVRLDSLSLHPADGGLVRESRELLRGIGRNPLNLSLSITLVLLHATAAGLKLWSAPYLAFSITGVVDKSAYSVSMPSVVIMLATAPMLGTYIGALICDRLEGFKAGHHASALRVACVFVVVAAVIAWLIEFVNGFGPRLSLIALWFFCAGAFLPICTGVLMTSMPSYLRSFSTAASNTVLHLVSFAVFPLICGAIMRIFFDLKKAMTFGVVFSLWMTVPAAILLVITYAVEPKSSNPTGLSGADDLSFNEIGYELSRRRMTTTPL